MERTLDKFTKAYIETALWSSMNEDGEALSDRYDIDDIADETLSKIIDDCQRFQRKNADDIAIGPLTFGPDFDAIECVGHDFWLTRNGHGAGFWDGDYPKEIGERLTKASEAFGECHIYVGDDGKLYI